MSYLIVSASDGGGGGGAEPILTPTDLVGTSTYDEETGILTVPNGAIAQLGDAWTFPVALASRFRWPTTVGSAEVYFPLCSDLEAGAFVGTGPRYRGSTTIGQTKISGTAASPSTSNTGSSGNFGLVPSAGDWIRATYSRRPKFSSGTARVEVWAAIEGAHGGSIGFDSASTHVEGDWSADADPQPTATLCVWNNSGQTVEVDLKATYVDVLFKTRD